MPAIEWIGTEKKIENTLGFVPGFPSATVPYSRPQKKARVVGVQWLGAPSGQIGVVPAGCWSKPGFKDCQARQFERARDECTAAFIPDMSLADIEACIRSLHQRYTEEVCVQQICPPEVITPGTSYPWLQYSASTLALQKEINRRIRDQRAAQGGNGYCEIAEDGKLGPQTCGAADAVYPEGVPSTCQGRQWRPPGLCTAASGAVSCPPGQIPVGDKCVTEVPPGQGVGPPPPDAAPTTPVAASRSNAGLILLAVGAAAAFALAMG